MGWDFEQVFVVRHGETEWSRLRRRQGQLDSPLTEMGQKSAQRVADRLSELDPDALFSSPLGRSWETATIIGKVLDLRVCAEAGLSEIHHGDLAGLTNDEIEQRHPGLLAHRRTELYTWRFPAGESYSDGDRRAALALGQIEASGARRPALVTHEMIARMLVRNLLGLVPDDALSHSFAHCTAYVVTPSSGMLTAD